MRLALMGVHQYRAVAGQQPQPGVEGDEDEDGGYDREELATVSLFR